MMGQRPDAQDKLFYSFNLDDPVPQDHLLRGIDHVLDLRELRAQLAPFYSHTGRPSTDPELILRMLIVGYCFGIRSEPATLTAAVTGILVSHPQACGSFGQRAQPVQAS